MSPLSSIQIPVLLRLAPTGLDCTAYASDAGKPNRAEAAVGGFM